MKSQLPTESAEGQMPLSGGFASSRNQETRSVEKKGQRTKNIPIVIFYLGAVEIIELLENSLYGVGPNLMM